MEIAEFNFFLNYNKLEFEMDIETDTPLILRSLIKFFCNSLN